ncbi:hypothetical protein G9P44_002332 [Scheffersomyces stipitis]|nr:hypothetical protein G9P44_002332 [Scheffersomyces stipitis]
MGVTGLLPCLKEIQNPGTLEQYRGKTLAIDTYGWLHRALISCAEELCLERPTRKYITSILKRVDMLRHFGVEPYFVFDGAALPTKAETANERRVKRQEARKKAEEYSKAGKRSLAWKEYMKAASVTSQMAKSVMVELDARGIKYIVAPYEADPQMVYLEKIGLVDGILSEDSDLLIFGCNRLITKLKDDGTLVEICRQDFHKVKSIPYLSKFSQEQLRLIAMLSGCDYTNGIQGIGIKTAFNLVQKHAKLERIVAVLRAEGKPIHEGFHDELHRANLAFQFQKVFNPKLQQLKTLHDYPEDLELDYEVLESCCGRTFSNELYIQICNGSIHPNTHEALVSREQSLSSLKSNSVNISSVKSAPAQLSQRSKSITATLTPKGPQKTVFDFFQVRKQVVSVSSITGNSVSSVTSLSTGSTTVKTSKTPEKRLYPASDRSKMSPTSRKMQRIADDPIPPASSVGKISKFFSSSSDKTQESQVKTVEPSSLSWDSSMIGDSYFSDEPGSPVKSVNTNDILEDLTDTDDPIFDPPENDTGNSTSEQSTSKVESTISDNFGIDDDDDEIEESPVKNKEAPRLQQVQPTKMEVLRENLREEFSFSMNPLPTRSNSSLTYSSNRSARLPLQAKDVNISSRSLKARATEPKSVSTFKPQTEKQQSQQHIKPPKKHIDLKQFAFGRN